MKIKVPFPLPLWVALLAGLSTAATAETPEEKGLAIAREADRREEGFGDTVATMRMTLRNRQGEESVREVRSRTLEVAGDGDKSLSVFDEPADVQGTAMLTFTHKSGPDDQWLYLPALKRVKRIASDNKSGPFMGSEFAFEDIASQEVEKYAWKWLRDDTLGGQAVFVLERDPVDPHSGYTRQTVWLDKAEYRPLRIEFFDRKNAALKTLVFHGYRQYLGKYWRAGEMVMENHQTGKSTRLEWKDWKFRAGLGARDFDQSALARVK